jgi:hypothetical protein
MVGPRAIEPQKGGLSMDAPGPEVWVPRTFPVSVKGVAVQAGKVLLLENERAGLFSRDEVPGLVMPDGYKRSVADWFARFDGSGTG